MESDKALVVFQGKKIRRTWFNDEWWFSVVDIIEALTESGRARKYWSDLKTKLQEEGFELSAKIGQLKLKSSDGKSYQTDCVNTKNAFRIIQSIPSRKAEPFKQWLAEVGYQRIQEIEDPLLSSLYHLLDFHNMLFHFFLCVFFRRSSNLILSRDFFHKDKQISTNDFLILPYRIKEMSLSINARRHSAFCT
ncbi:Bro-N domain-containing protein [Patescibacteria group bacterium]|nr:Bro-N domain-containing protein [Patescibacteria group bacterium]